MDWQSEVNSRGGVENVEIHHCRIQDTDSGIELKASDERGGYIKNVRIQDCCIDSFFAHSTPYNSDGVKATELPKFENIQLQNVEISGNRRNYDVMGHPTHAKGKAIELIGFAPTLENNSDYFINQLTLNNIKIDRPTDSIYLNRCKNVQFSNIHGADETSQEVRISFGPQVLQFQLN
ncbi:MULTISPECIES: hypothetical protein [Lactobacillaceae]|uniref:hypothetical protein n=1 Tax=Lactobacillaceae TaxID=33958 RepID=UPI0014577376|nr:hypothetical protein [Lactobacillus sp. HBUAS51381]NLR09898.1 hypothetical protein [Lactobacillus sp. HBUAS51381]